MSTARSAGGTEPSTSSADPGRAALPTTIHFPHPAPVALPGPRSRRGGAGGLRGCGADSRPGARVARGRSTNFRTTTLRPSPVASAGTGRGVPAAHATQTIVPAGEAGPKEENRT